MITQLVRETNIQVGAIYATIINLSINSRTHRIMTWKASCLRLSPHRFKKQTRSAIIYRQKTCRLSECVIDHEKGNFLARITNYSRNKQQSMCVLCHYHQTIYGTHGLCWSCEGRLPPPSTKHVQETNMQVGALWTVNTKLFVASNIVGFAKKAFHVKGKLLTMISELVCEIGNSSGCDFSYCHQTICGIS